MTLKKVSRLSAIALLLAAPGLLLAAESAPASSTASIPNWTDLLTSWGLTTNGYVAASYYHSNGYPFNIHQFDIQHDTFQLDQAGLAVAYLPKSGFGALIDVIAGEDAKLLHAAEDGNGNSIDLKQAFLQYANGPVTVIAGKFGTLAGAEVIAPTANANFSRSLLFFFNEPLTHTGVRATWAVSDTFTLIGGINNGWNATSTSYGSKTGEVGVVWIPNKTFSLTAQAYFGPYGITVPSPLPGQRSLVDVVATCNATSALTLILNADYNKQDEAFGSGTSSASWSGVAAYLNYAMNDQWRLSLRLEYEDDKDGYLAGTGVREYAKEATLTLGYAPTKHFELRVEGRYDKTSDDFLYRSNPALTGNGAVPELADNLFQFAMQGVFKFGT